MARTSKCMNREWFIYVVECETTGKVYVGCTVDFDRRIYGHFRNPQEDMAIGREIRRLGWNCWSERVVEGAKTKKEGRLRERFWVHLLEANEPQFGYNSPTIYPWTGEDALCSIRIAPTVSRHVLRAAAIENSLRESANSSEVRN